MTQNEINAFNWRNAWLPYSSDMLRAITTSLSNASVTNIIEFNTAIPFTAALTDMATHTMTADVTLTVNLAGAVDNACTQLLLVNNSSYTADVTAFHSIGVQDNTKAYSLLTFQRKRGIYLVSIVNFD